MAKVASDLDGNPGHLQASDVGTVISTVLSTEEEEAQNNDTNGIPTTGDVTGANFSAQPKQKRKSKQKPKWKVIGAAPPPSSLQYLWQSWFKLHTNVKLPPGVPTPPALPRAPVSRLPGLPVVRRIGRSASRDDIFLVTCESLRIFVVAEGLEGDQFGPTACRRVAIACVLIGLLYHRHAPSPFGLDATEIDSLPEVLRSSIHDSQDTPNLKPDEREGRIATILKAVQDEWIKTSSISHQKQEEFQTTLSSSTGVHVLIGSRILSGQGKASSCLKKWGTMISKTVCRLARPSPETTQFTTQELIDRYPATSPTEFRDFAVGLGTSFSEAQVRSYAESITDLTTFLASCSPEPHITQDYKEELNKTSATALMTRYLDLCDQAGVAPERRENAFMMALALTCGVPMLKKQHRLGGVDLDIMKTAEQVSKETPKEEADLALHKVLGQIPGPLRLLYGSCCMMNKSSTYVMKKFQEVKLYARCGQSWGWWFKARYIAQKNRPVVGPTHAIRKRKRSESADEEGATGLAPDSATM